MTMVFPFNIPTSACFFLVTTLTVNGNKFASFKNDMLIAVYCRELWTDGTDGERDRNTNSDILCGYTIGVPM